jgi:hypothetical protein
MVVMWTKKSRHVRSAGWEGCTSGKGIRCTSTAVIVPGFALDSGGIAATGAAAEVSADGAWGTVLALPSCAGSSGSSTIPFIILEVDATFNQEPLAGAGTTALRYVLRVVQWPLLARLLPNWAVLPLLTLNGNPRFPESSHREHRGRTGCQLLSGARPPLQVRAIFGAYSGIIELLQGTHRPQLMKRAVIQKTRGRPWCGSSRFRLHRRPTAGSQALESRPSPSAMAQVPSQPPRQASCFGPYLSLHDPEWTKTPADPLLGWLRSRR